VFGNKLKKVSESENFFLQGGEIHMKTLVGGAAAAVLGLIGLVVWWSPFLTLLAGAIPLMLLLGGGLAIYLGFDELKDTWKKDDSIGSPVGSDDDVDKYKKEIDDLKQEIDNLKSA
jgi:hypothetical protein